MERHTVTQAQQLRRMFGSCASHHCSACHCGRIQPSLIVRFQSRFDERYRISHLTGPEDGESHLRCGRSVKQAGSLSGEILHAELPGFN